MYYDKMHIIRKERPKWNTHLKSTELFLFFPVTEDQLAPSQEAGRILGLSVHKAASPLLHSSPSLASGHDCKQERYQLLQLTVLL